MRNTILKKIETKFLEVLEKIKRVFSYQLLSNSLNFYKQKQLFYQEIGEIKENTVVDMKLNYEFIQMLYITIKEELKIEDYNESMFLKLLN